MIGATYAAPLSASAIGRHYANYAASTKRLRQSRGPIGLKLLPTGQSEPRSYVTVSNFHKDPLTGLIHAGR